MHTKLNFEFHQIEFNLHGFTLLRNCIRHDFREYIVRRVAEASSYELTEGDVSTHSWKEVNIQPNIELSDFLVGVKLSHIIGFEPVSMVQWTNVYNEGKFIDAHVDAGGDAQLLIPLVVPKFSKGGLIWIGETHKTLPMRVGDILIFAAHRLLHGTTPVLNGQRISFNVRLWSA